jgi:hypothetical protein
MSPAVPSKAIDPARKGLSKSTVTAADWCGRKAVYLEQVRDKDGRRVHAAMPERVHFGSAVDDATQSLMVWYDTDQRLRMEEISIAARNGVESVKGKAFTDAVNWDAFLEEVELATALFAEWLVTKSAQVLPMGMGLLTQGINGDSLSVKFPKAGLVIGTPDAIFAPFTEHAVILDIKTGQRHKSMLDLNGSEMRFYAALYAKQFPDAPLPRLALMSYSRPKVGWNLVIRQSTPDDVALGVMSAQVVAKSVKGKPEHATFNTQQCKSCQYAAPLPDYGFGGCEVGLMMSQKEESNGEA